MQLLLAKKDLEDHVSEFQTSVVQGRYNVFLYFK